MAVAPRIANLDCTPLRFLPGDRILVRVHHRIELEQIKKLKNSIQKWSGVPVENICIYSDLDMEITIDAKR